MDKVIALVLTAFLATGVLLPGMGWERERMEAGQRERDVELLLTAVASGVLEDPEFVYRVAGGVAEPSLCFDPEPMARLLWEAMGDSLEMVVYCGPEYLRIDRGEGFGPPRFYVYPLDGELVYFHRGAPVSRIWRAGSWEYGHQGMEYREAALGRDLAPAAAARYRGVTGLFVQWRTESVVQGFGYRADLVFPSERGIVFGKTK